MDGSTAAAPDAGAGEGAEGAAGAAEKGQQVDATGGNGAGAGANENGQNQEVQGGKGGGGKGKPVAESPGKKGQKKGQQDKGKEKDSKDKGEKDKGRDASGDGGKQQSTDGSGGAGAGAGEAVQAGAASGSGSGGGAATGPQEPTHQSVLALYELIGACLKASEPTNSPSAGCGEEGGAPPALQSTASLVSSSSGGLSRTPSIKAGASAPSGSTTSSFRSTLAKLGLGRKGPAAETAAAGSQAGGAAAAAQATAAKVVRKPLVRWWVMWVVVCLDSGGVCYVRWQARTCVRFGNHSLRAAAHAHCRTGGSLLHEHQLRHAPKPVPARCTCTVRPYSASAPSQAAR